MAKPKDNPLNDHANDPADMFGAILAWPERLRAGFASELPDLPDDYCTAANIVVCGMGGSAIGASLVGGLLADELSVPLTVVRDYGLPAAVGADTLVIAVSHSGGTEETLSAFSQARAKGARRIAVTAGASGNALAEQAAADGVPTIEYDCPGQPRAALPHVLGLLLKLFGALGYAPDQSGAIDTAAAHLDEISRDVRATEDNLAATVADALAGKIPIVYGAGFLAEAARRMKGQISENGKQTAAWEVLPEDNHNAIAGYEFPKQLGDYAVFVLLRSTIEHPRHTVRFEFVKELLNRRGLPCVEITGTGGDRLAQLTSVIFWGDLASYYLARKNGVDPTPVDVLVGLKAKLAEDDA
jgi:glucose/mannose-6-phosphate isomerase